MFRSMYTAASGMTAQQMNLDNIANNLANSSTAGFRRRRLQFQDMLYQNFIMPGSAATQQTTMAAGLQIGLGARTAASEVTKFVDSYASSTALPDSLLIVYFGAVRIVCSRSRTAFRVPAGAVR